MKAVQSRLTANLAHVNRQNEQRNEAEFSQDFLFPIEPIAEEAEMKRSALLIVLVAAMTLASGCFSTTFQYSNKTPGRTEEVGRTFLIYGLVNSNDALKAYDLCPEGVQSVQTVHTFGDQFLGCLTIGIYTPNTVRVTCASGAAHNFYLDEDDNVVARQSYDESGTLVSETVASDVL